MTRNFLLSILQVLNIHQTTTTSFRKEEKEKETRHVASFMPRLLHPVTSSSLNQIKSVKIRN